MLSPISPSSDIYPDGLPSDYSVIATFKVPRVTAKTSWNLWQVSDPEGREQVGLRFQGDTKTLDFFYTSPRGTQMLRTFQRVEKLFDGEWHKLALSVKGEQVKLLVDCDEVSVESLDEPRPVIRQGFTSIVKRAVGDRSVSVSTRDRLEYFTRNYQAECKCFYYLLTIKTSHSVKCKRQCFSEKLLSSIQSNKQISCICLQPIVNMHSEGWCSKYISSIIVSVLFQYLLSLHL